MESALLSLSAVVTADVLPIGSGHEPLCGGNDTRIAVVVAVPQPCDGRRRITRRLLAVTTARGSASTGWVALTALSVVASAFPVKVPGVPVYFSISDTFFVTSALLFGPAPATVTVAVDTLLMGGGAETNAANALQLRLLCVGVVRGAYHALSPHQPLAMGWSPLGSSSIGALAWLALVHSR